MWSVASRVSHLRLCVFAEADFLILCFKKSFFFLPEDHLYPPSFLFTLSHSLQLFLWCRHERPDLHAALQVALVKISSRRCRPLKCNASTFDPLNLCRDF